MLRLWGLFTLTRRRNILATYLSYIRRNVNQYSITTTYDLIIEWHENANLDIKHKSQIPITYRRILVLWYLTLYKKTQWQ